MKRKLLSVLLTLCLAFSLLPTAALAMAKARLRRRKCPRRRGLRCLRQ